MNNKFSQLDIKKHPRFSGVRTFFRFPTYESETDFEHADVAIVGVPYDGGTSFRPGARFGPEKIRSMSSLGRGYHAEKESDVFKKLKIIDAGDVSIVPQDIEQTHRNIKEHIRYLLEKNCFPLIVGGDHSTSIGSLEAAYEHYGPLGIIHFDAHTDTYPAAWGCDVHHGTFMRLGHERGWFRPDAVIQIGVRGPFSHEDDLKVPNDYGYKVFSVDDIRLKGFETLRSAIGQMSSRPFYLSFDIDCLDPAYAPGTGTPVPGGFTTWEIFQMLRMLSSLNFIGADLVEVSPPYDSSDITSLAAVYVMSEMLALI